MTGVGRTYVGGGGGSGSGGGGDGGGGGGGGGAAATRDLRGIRSESGRKSGAFIVAVFCSLVLVDVAVAAAAVVGR